MKSGHPSDALVVDGIMALKNEALVLNFVVDRETAKDVRGRSSTPGGRPVPAIRSGKTPRSWVRRTREVGGSRLDGFVLRRLDETSCVWSAGFVRLSVDPDRIGDGDDVVYAGVH